MKLVELKKCRFEYREKELADISGPPIPLIGKIRNILNELSVTNTMLYSKIKKQEIKSVVTEKHELETEMRPKRNQI